MKFVLICLLLLGICSAFVPGRRIISQTSTRKRNLNMMEIELNSATYAGIAVVTLIPSLLFVKFVGDAADNSKDNITEEQKASFKARMMDTNRGFVSFGVPSTEEELLQDKIRQAYMQDKDVDVAVLEEKLRQRVQWRKEMAAEAKTLAEEDEDGW
jgi:hypothetical protein